MRRKILMVTESSTTLSGYGTYTKALLSRLHKSGKYEVAELAGYAHINTPGLKDIPWKVYPNGLDPSNPNDPRHQILNSQPINQFGAWRLERVCLDFKPDIVFDIRDPWMLMFEGQSPLRKFYHWVIMPTVDSAPQQEEWIDSFMQADRVFTYSDWGLDVLKQQSCNLIKTERSAPPGVDENLFKPVANKLEHRRQLGFQPDMFIVGTIMRNQRRKLFPDLINAFKIYLEKCYAAGKADLANKSYLYFHTSYPDVVGCWNMPRLLKESGISHKILWTYICRNCRHISVSPFQDGRTVCAMCNNVSATLPSVGDGLTQPQLVDILNLFDVYAQYAVCLGPNEEILTINGWKSIKHVNVGDFVWTHNGRWRQVTNTFINPAPDLVKKVTLASDYECINTITNEHPLYVISKKNVCPNSPLSVREYIGRKIKDNSPKQFEPQFVETGSVEIGDLVATVIDDTICDYETILLDDYTGVNDTINEFIIDVKNGNSYNRYLKIDKDFCRFLGLYVADGCSCDNTIKITQHLNETTQTDIVPILNRLGEWDTREYQGRLGIDYLHNSSLHAKFFLDNCGKQLTKKFPEFAMRLALDKQKEMLIGLCRGDGCYSKGITVYVTISPVLATQLKEILQRLRINYNVHTDKKAGNRQPQYRFEIAGDIKNGIFETKRKSTNSLYYKQWYLQKIKNISDVFYKEDYVYNIEVEEDNSYTTRIGITHNCEGFGMPQVEAAACSVPVFATDYSAMSDVVRKVNGFPIMVQKLTRVVEEDAYKAVPDDNDFADKLFRYAQLSIQEKRKHGEKARAGVEKHYLWDKTAKIWSDYFDSAELTGLQGKWDAPPSFIQPRIDVSNIPDIPSNQDFVNWAVANTVGPEYLDSLMALDMVRALNYELVVGLRERERYTRKHVIDKLIGMVNNINHCEQARCGMLPLPAEDYIQFANRNS